MHLLKLGQLTVEVEECDVRFLSEIAQWFGPDARRLSARFRTGDLGFSYDPRTRGARLVDLAGEKKRKGSAAELTVVQKDIASYEVSSRSEESPHLVDLECFAGNGKCSCGEFEFQMEPLLARGMAGGSKYQCAHIQAAREVFATDCLRRLGEQREKNVHRRGAESAEEGK